MDIKEARKQIDSIDAVLVAEFEKRLSLIKEIGKYKDEHHLPLVDEARDVKLLLHCILQIAKIKRYHRMLKII